MYDPRPMKAAGLASRPSNSLAVGCACDCGAGQKQYHSGSQHEEAAGQADSQG